MFIRLTLIFVFLVSLNGYGQMNLPYSGAGDIHSKWAMEFSERKVPVGQIVDLIFTVKIDKNWYLYSNDFSADCGPIVASFTFFPHPSYELIGQTLPIKPKKKVDEVFGCEVSYFLEKAEFRQKIKILSQDFKISGLIRGQICSEVDGKCVNIDDLEFPAKGQKPDIEIVALEKGGLEVIAQNKQNQEVKTASSDTLRSDSMPKPTTSRKEYSIRTESKDESLLGFMVVAFLSGLAAIFTPCVFPMIPLTVSFFSKKQKIHAFIYSVSIIAVYSLTGAVLAPLMGPGAAYVLSTHWLPNLLFFLIFLAFALSFFGMFDIVLPSGLVNAMDKNAEKGGFLGTFFMAFTLVLVSFSCTGPIVGSILIASAGGETVKPIAGMFAFSSAFALPFGLFAFFPGLILDNKGRSKIKSGSWLNSVKVTLGFIELALAFKFLSVIDLIYHLGILNRDVNIAIWMAIALFMGLYYLGKIRLPHDSEVTHVPVLSMLLALICFAFFFYLLPGMFGAPLNALSGILPPSTTHSFDFKTIVRENSDSQNDISSSNQLDEVPLYGDRLKFAHGIKGYFDYEQGMRVAKKLRKPVFIDFTGHSCANCRKMEDLVWSDPEVLKRLKNDYVMIALYADENLVKPESQWYVSRVDGRMKRTVGQQNLDFQIEKFNENAQPLYVLLDNDGTLLQNPRAFDTNVQEYIKFLDAGLAEYKKRHSIQ